MTHSVQRDKFQCLYRFRIYSYGDIYTRIYHLLHWTKGNWGPHFVFSFGSSFCGLMDRDNFPSSYNVLYKCDICLLGHGGGDIWNRCLGGEIDQLGCEIGCWICGRSRQGGLSDSARVNRGSVSVCFAR